MTLIRLAGLFSKHRTFSAYNIRKCEKPKPDLFLHAASQMSCEPSRCVVIGESLAGIQAGLTAGTHVIGYSPDSQLGQNSEVSLVHSPLDLIDVLA